MATPAEGSLAAPANRVSALMEQPFALMVQSHALKIYWLPPRLATVWTMIATVWWTMATQAGNYHAAQAKMAYALRALLPALLGLSHAIKRILQQLKHAMAWMTTAME
jgi:hypothetical protein